MNLLKAMIDKEVSRTGMGYFSSIFFFAIYHIICRCLPTESDTELFRSNSMYTRFLSAFAKLYGYNYLRNLIAPLVKNMTALPPGETYDLDPSKVSEQQAASNRKTVEVVASSFLDIITSSVPAFPS